MSRRRQLLECWWFVFLVPLGVLSWAAFVYIGLRAGRRLWLVYAVLYFTWLGGVDK